MHILAAALIFSTLISEKPLTLRSFLVVVAIKLYTDLALASCFVALDRARRLTPTVLIPFALSFAISEALTPG
jgi:hypothetical protein